MGTQSGSQTTTQNTTLPKWYTDAAKGNINFANAAATNLAKPYMGNTVAGLDPLQKQGIAATGANVGSTNAGFNNAQATTNAVANYTPQNFLSGNLGAYMNPFIANVENAALTNANQAFRQNLNSIGTGAQGAGAFGGSRHGVTEGVAAAENARQMGDLSAQLRSSGFNAATGMMTADMDRLQQAQQIKLNAGAQQGNLASAQQDAYLKGLDASIAAGGINQSYEQGLLNQSRDQYNANRDVPLEQLNIRTAGLSGIQVPTSTTQKTPTTGNNVLGGVGALLSGVGSLAALSDEDEKTNIRKLGKDGLTGLPLYAYDYKSDVAAAKKNKTPMPPKRVGPMAQDIERREPGRVREVGGKKIVANLGFGG